ncbi:hypothetical protein [Streptomyces thermodiastaticus]|uniref:hypothetical protein n=1 Tax=Streptomyces thermodiastaticus TaxID=44061 RepID=UPI0016793DDE|nr:hypothetical protein [Streptomyces thermodiastaticus]MCE7551493.1 hypothetical protein [Streptomyces thermodiastaticus]
MNAYRAWVARARPAQLTEAARSGLSWASRVLIDEHGCPPDVVWRPQPDQLRALLEVLEPTLARCALYGLLSAEPGELPAAETARAYLDVLRAAADQQPPSNLAETLRRVVTTAGDQDTGGTAAAARDLPGGSAEEDAVAAAPHRPGPLDDGLAQLRDLGGHVAVTLRAAADDVESGRRPGGTDDLVASLTAWAALRDQVADLCADTGVDWPDGAGYTWLAAERQRLDKIRAERAALEERARSYEALIEQAGDPEEAATLGMLRDRLYAQIEELSAALGKGVGTAGNGRSREPLSGISPAGDAGESRPAAGTVAGEPDGGGRGGAKQTEDDTRTAETEIPQPRQGDEPVQEADRRETAPAHLPPAAAAPQDGDGSPQAGMSAAERTQPEQPEPEPQRPGEPTEQSGSSGPTASLAVGAAPHTVAADLSEPERPTADTSGDTDAPPAVPADTAPDPREQLDDETGEGAGEPGTAPDQEPWPASVADADWDVQAPWETGHEPPVVRLVRSGRLAEAYWMTQASAEPDVRARALAFAAAAFRCTTESEATDVQILHDLDPAPLAQDRDAHLVALVAALRTGLTARWPHTLVSDFTAPAGLAGPWQELLTVLVAAVRNGRSFDPGTQHADDVHQEQDLREELGVQARQLLERLAGGKTKYQRATRVLQYLVGRTGELGRALRDVIHWVDGGPLPADGFRARAEALRDQDHIDRLIDQTDSRFRTPKQAKEPITAGALRQLHAACRSVSDLLTKADAVAASLMRPSGTAQSGIPDLAAARRGLREVPPPPGVGGAALLLLHNWLDGKAPVLPFEDLPERDGESERLRPSADCLLVLPDLPRDDMGMPDLRDPRTGRRMAALMAPPDVEHALRRYLDRGDLHLARGLVDAVRRDPAGHGVTDSKWADSAERRLQQARENWREKVRCRHTEAADVLAQMRTLNLLAPDQERQFTGRLQEFAHGEDAGRYRYAMARLDELSQELSQLVQQSTQRQRQELEQLRLTPGRLSEAEYDRIARLITEGDTVTAEEFLALARGGKPLPERPEDDGTELADFLDGLTGSGVPQPGGDGVDADWWASTYGSDAPLTEAAELGLESWKALCTRHGRTNEWKQHLPRVLRLLGLEPSGTPVAETRSQGVRRFRVRARVAERTGYVAALGSQATSYTVQLIWEEQRANGPLAHLEDGDVDANLVLYLHPLGVEGRRRLADASRSGGQQALVIDPAVAGWMAARAPGSFRALQRVTLPWAAYNPYTPFVAGLVPPEVFYGRDEEMREVMDPRGGLFLYGGRQLGKSALLRRVAEIFRRRSDDYIAVYLDLLKAEIGQAEAPDKIWSLLAEELKRRGVFNSRLSEQAGPDVIARRLGDWLDEDTSRRLLVLADEADAFLTADSRRTFKIGGESTFPNVKRFQQLMERSDRRFKIVFAGLHQVQRFGALSNVSTAHGGPDVLVGPLKPQAALRLVTEPMAALGYVFARPELVWRILAITNYQANLVQIFCSELVRTLHSRPYVPTGRATEITDSDVQEVAASETLRRRIAERLRFTINLEDRYRVLALVIALRSLEDGYRGGYSAKELLDLARDAWPEGFEECGVQQAEIYLTEMVGLGLLIRLGDRAGFAVRSPNVVNMLGTREELELELHETEFGLPYDYNPRAARRVLGRDRNTGVQRYSPLTEGQLHEAAQPGVSVVATTALHQPALVLQAVAAFAEGRGVKVFRVERGADLRSGLSGAAAARPRRAHVVLADLRGIPADDLDEQLRLCVDHAGPAADKHVPQNEGRKDKQTRSVLVLADAETVASLRATDDGRRLRVRVLQPRRWTADSLRAWPECPFVSREDRRRLTAATSGWPYWTEVAVADVSLRGATLDDAVDNIRKVTAKPGNVAEHLRQSGLTEQDLSLLEMWTAYVEEGQGVPVDDVQAATGLSADETREWLAHLDRLDVLDEVDKGLAVDPVTFRAVRARAAEAP